METIETLIPDNEGNHLVVVLYFYDKEDMVSTYQIPVEFTELDIADINITKLDLKKPVRIRAFFEMCRWLWEQFMLYPNAVFSFICSTDSIETRRPDILPQQYRWNLFENFYMRYNSKLNELGIHSKDIVVGPSGFQTYARVFYRDRHSSIIHLVISNLNDKYTD
jgi:hypothetical protein